MVKVRNLSDNQQEIAFTEFDFYQRYVETFKTSELGKIKRLLPLHEMAMSFGLIEEKPKSLRTPRGRKPFFTPEGKVALAFLKMHTGLSAPGLLEALNGNIHYQIFCGVRIIPRNQGYSGNDNRTFCKEKGIETSFTQKGRIGKNEVKNATKRELARVRATAMEGSFGTQKKHYGLRKIAVRIKSTEILLIFFGIHTANVVNLARRESVQVSLAA